MCKVQLGKTKTSGANVSHKLARSTNMVISYRRIDRTRWGHLNDLGLGDRIGPYKILYLGP